MRSRKKASRRVRHELGQDVPDSGQEHLAHSDNGFLVTTTSLDAAIAFSKFRMLSGMDERVGHLNQKRFKVRACTGNASGLNLCAALVIPWATASPRTQVLGCWKYGHVAAYLRKDSNSRHRIIAEAGDSAQELENICKGFTDAENLLLQALAE